MKNVHIVNNPLIHTALTNLRDKTTSLAQFRMHAVQISQFLLSSASADLPMDTKMIDTPLTNIESSQLSKNIQIITILRAGLAMLEPAMHFFPNAPIGIVGLKRDEQTAKASEYYWNIPTIHPTTTILLLDPMLATGGSMLSVLEKIAKNNPKEIRIISIVTAPEGIEAIHAVYPNIAIYTAAVDSHLNDQKYIVPGLGDFGDRYFGTIIAE